MPVTPPRAPRGPGTPHPCAPGATAIGICVIGTALALVARSTGAGWLQVILAGLAGVLVAGALWPAVVLARTAVSVQAPRDATVGRAATLTVAVTGSTIGKLTLPQFGTAWHAARGDEAGDIVVVPSRRGVLDTVVVEMRCAAPFGVLWWRRRFRCGLGRPVAVGPAPTTPAALPWAAEQGGRDGAAPGGHGGEVVRGVRDYTAGDPPKLVLWSASARTGTLVVRDLEGASTPRMSISVDLRGEPGAVEGAASQAAGLCAAALADGFEVELATAEAHGPRRGPVTSAVEAGRRLAHAVGGPPAATASAGVVIAVDAGAPRRHAVPPVRN